MDSPHQLQRSSIVEIDLKVLMDCVAVYIHFALTDDSTSLLLDVNQLASEVEVDLVLGGQRGGQLENADLVELHLCREWGTFMPDFMMKVRVVQKYSSSSERFSPANGSFSMMLSGVAGVLGDRLVSVMDTLKLKRPEVSPVRLRMSLRWTANSLFAMIIRLQTVYMASRTKQLFNLNVNAPTKVRVLAVHPKKEWVAVITSSSIFFLWNYRSRSLIKSFNCNTLDDSKNFDIRQMVFFDRHSLPYNPSSTVKPHIIFVSAYRIYLYDYSTDAIKQINQKEIEQKNIRKVCVYSQSKICVSLNDGSFKVLDSKDLYAKNTMTIKNIRGYHTKPINWMIAYCQNANEAPRIITASSQDGLMACWNVDTLLHAHQVPDPAIPSFKFLMQKGSKNDSNNGEEILSLQYDNSSYRLVTLTESYITIWSTMTGMELRRLKNRYKYKEIAFFNHFSFGANCFLVHSHKSQLSLLRVNASDEDSSECIDLRGYADGDSNIVTVKTLPQNSSQIFICTPSNLVVVEINKFYRPSFGFHQGFTTKLTTLNNKEFVIRSEGCFKPDISTGSLSNIPFEEDILFNTFYLSFEAGWIVFNLIEIQYQNMLFEQRKYKMRRVAEDSPFFKPISSQALIEVRFDGRELFIFNRQIAYYEIYGIMDQTESLLNLNQQSLGCIDFHSKLALMEGGYARDIVWHQYKHQFAVIKGFDKKDKLIEYISEKKGLLSKERQFKFSAEVVTYRVCIFEKTSADKPYSLIFKSEPFKTSIFKIFNFGLLFGYSKDNNGSQIVVYINDENTSNKYIQGEPIWPERVFVSYCESYQIFTYDGYFIIYKVEENGNLTYFRTVFQTIHEGMFWQKIFFFSTKQSIYFMQITSTDIVLIKIADSMSSTEQKTQVLELDDLQDHQNLLPEGQLQMLTVLNMHLMMLNHSGQLVLLNLKSFPYIEFCIEVILGNTERLQAIYKTCNGNIRKIMKDTSNAYGLMLQQLQ